MRRRGRGLWENWRFGDLCLSVLVSPSASRSRSLVRHTHGCSAPAVARARRPGLVLRIRTTWPWTWLRSSIRANTLTTKYPSTHLHHQPARYSARHTCTHARASTPRLLLVVMTTTTTTTTTRGPNHAHPPLRLHPPTCMHANKDGQPGRC